MKILAVAALILMSAARVADAAAPSVPFVCEPEQMSVQPIYLHGAKPYLYKSINGIDLRLHVFEPPLGQGTANRPAIIFFFGGGWAGGGIAHFAPQAKYLADRGMVAIVADYRVFCRNKTGPAEAMTDARSAIRWVRSHARALHIDPDHIAAGGGSAGGQLALSATLAANFDDPSENKGISSKPDALVLFNPVVDLTEPSMVKNYGAIYGGSGSELSPSHYTTKAIPPTVIFHGKADILVSYASVEKYCGESRSFGNDCTLFGYEGAGHGFYNRDDEVHRWYQQTMQETEKFLVRLGYLPLKNR